MNVVILRAKVTETQQELQDVVDAANHVMGGVLAAADAGTSLRSEGSSLNKRRRSRKRMKEIQSESASIYHPSSHTDPLKKPRLDHD